MKIFTFLAKMITTMTGASRRFVPFNTVNTATSIENSKTFSMENFFTMLKKKIAAMHNSDNEYSNTELVLQPVLCTTTTGTDVFRYNNPINDAPQPAASFSFIPPQAINHSEKKFFMKTEYALLKIYLRY